MQRVTSHRTALYLILLGCAFIFGAVAGSPTRGAGTRATSVLHNLLLRASIGAHDQTETVTPASDYTILPQSDFTFESPADGASTSASAESVAAPTTASVTFEAEGHEGDESRVASVHRRHDWVVAPVFT